MSTKNEELTKDQATTDLTEAQNRFEKDKAATIASLNNQIKNVQADIEDLTTLITNGNTEIGTDSALTTVKNLQTKLKNAKTELDSARSELNSKTSNLPDEIDDKIDEMVSKYSNSDFNPVSFASEENTNVESVQFAIRTYALKVKDEEKVEEEKVEEKNMWQLFTDLFKNGK